MTLVLHWLIYILLENKLLGREECVSLIEQLGENADINTFAQEAYNVMSANLDEITAKEMLDNYEEAVELAEKMTEQGDDVPELSFEEDEASETESLENVDDVFSIPDNEVTLLLKHLLEDANNEGASDLYLSAGFPPFIRKAREMHILSDDVLSKEEAERLNYSVLTDMQKKIFKENNNINIPLSIGASRYRLNLFKQMYGVSGAYHLTSDKPKTLEQLGFLNDAIDTIDKMLRSESGLIIIAGSIDSGKTTTLASIVNYLNIERNAHILSFENPIEIIQHSKDCNINQREIYTHTQSFSSAIECSNNEAPDIIVLSELNDPEIIEYAIKTANSSKLVIAVLTASNTTNAVNRIINIFPDYRHSYIRAVLARSLRGIICQKILVDINDSLTVAAEILVNSSAISTNINEGKIYLLKQSMQVGKKDGMCIMDDYIYELFKNGTITDDIALESLDNPRQYSKMIRSSEL